jgi:hypothetical protein
MGQLVLAAKVSHLPSPMLSEQNGSPLKAARQGAVAALRAIGRGAKERRVSTFVVFDTHWLSDFGYHINANLRHRGSFTSHEAPQMFQDLHCDPPGDQCRVSSRPMIFGSPRQSALPRPGVAEDVGDDRSHHQRAADKRSHRRNLVEREPHPKRHQRRFQSRDQGCLSGRQ